MKLRLYACKVNLEDSKIKINFECEISTSKIEWVRENLGKNIDIDKIKEVNIS